MHDELAEYAKKTTEDKLAFLRVNSVFADLIYQPAFSKRYVEAINELYLPISNIKNIMKNTLNQKIAAEKL